MWDVSHGWGQDGTWAGCAEGLSLSRREELGEAKC